MNMSMRIKFTSLVASALLLAACHGFSPPGGGSSDTWSHGKGKAKDNVRCKTNAQTNICSVSIDYEDPDDVDCGDYCFAVAPAYIVIDPPANSETQYVEWNLRASGRAQFDTEKGGIKFEENSPFKDCAVGKAPNGNGNEKYYHCTNTESGKAKPWKYTIYLKLQKDERVIQPTDPWVVNK